MHLRLAFFCVYVVFVFVLFLVCCQSACVYKRFLY